MNAFVHFLMHSDPCTTVMLIFLLTVVGRAMAGQYPQVQNWGLRLAAAAFIGFGIFLLIHSRSMHADTLLNIAFRALLAAGLALGVGWILLSAGYFMYKTFFADAINRRRLAAEETRQKAATERQQQEAVSRCPSAADAPADKLAEKEAQTRRSEARARCERLFLIHAPEIKDRFTRDHFDKYVRDFLRDNHSPEFVEKCAAQLEEIILEHAGKSGTAKPLSITEQAAELDKQVQEITESNLDDRTKQALITSLKQQFLHRLEREMESK